MSNTLKRMQKRKDKEKAKAKTGTGQLVSATPAPAPANLPKILIGVPSNRDLCKEFVASLMGLTRTVGIDNIVLMQNGMINQCRDSIVKWAVQKGYEYIFWMDDDMIIPPNAITQLLSHDLDIVSGLYFGRGNYLPLMFDIQEDKEVEESFYSFQNHREYKDNDLMNVDAIGFGCVLTKVSALLKVWNDERDGIGGTCFDFIGGLGEDLSFALRCRQCGIETWVDTSIKCGHIGKITVTEDMYKALILKQEQH